MCIFMGIACLAIATFLSWAKHTMEYEEKAREWKKYEGEEND